MTTARVGIGFVLLLAIAATMLSALAPLTAKATADALAEVDLPSVSLYKINGLEIEAADHGVERHGAVYVQVVQQCIKGGAQHIYLEPDKSTLHFLCAFEDGSVGDLVAKLTRGAKILYEKSGYSRARNMQEALRIMVHKGATPIKIATILKWLGIQ